MEESESPAQRLVAQHFKSRAALIRCGADEMTRPTMRRQLLRVAEEYDWIADRIEAETFVPA